MASKYNKLNIKYINNEFEQSITIYSNKSKNKNTLPLIIFIPGSAWLGHVPLLYYVFNWWNSSLAKNLAKNGYTVAFLRHRGAFFKYTLNFSNSLFILLLILLFFNFFLGFLFFILILMNNYLKSTAPEYDNILEDILNHFMYLDNNYDLFKVNFNFSDEVILVGYSSGVQVLCEILLKKPIIEYKKLFVKNIVLISGVFNLYEKIINSNTEYKIANYCINLYNSWLFKDKLKSPMQIIQDLPSKEYTIIGCFKELPDFPIIKSLSNQLFCSNKFYDRLQKYCVKSKIILIDSNHWSILSDKKLISIFNDLI